MRLTPQQRIWLASGTMLAAAAALWLTVVAALPAAATPGVPWWALIPLFFVAERWPVTVNLRRGLPSLGMACAPLVIGLFLVPPAGVLAAFFAGTAIAVAVRRHIAIAQTVFSAGQFAVFAACAEVVLHAALPLHGTSNLTSWQAWAAAGAAAGVLVAGNLLAILAVAAQEGGSSPAQVARQVFDGVAGAAAACCFGLLAVAVLHLEPLALVLLGAIALAFLTVYRSYVAERQDRLALQFLHGAGHALSKRELEAAVLQLLREARSMFSAQLAQITIFPSSPGEKAFRTTVRATGSEQVMEPLELSELDDILEADSDGVIVERSNASTGTSDVLARRGVSDAMVALLRGETRILGSLLVGGHVDSRTFDSRDLHLFRALAIQTSTTLENGRLERSIARLTELQEKLTHQAFHDSLTDLANRTLFGDRIDHALRRSLRLGRAIAVLFIDVDDFKGVNDTLGHAAGDLLLVGIAERLRGSLRRPDTAARLGGDEFAVLIEDLDDTAEAEVIAKRIFEALRAPFEVMGHTVNVRVSIGLALSEGIGDNASNLMRHADVAMYSAKGAGKDRWVAFAPGMETEIVSRHRLRGDLEQALTLEQFLVHYQPIVDLVTGDITGVEALVRWKHPTRGLIGPNEFISMAEESGLILPLGDFVLRSACATLLKLQGRHPQRIPLSVNVNISARQLQQPLFVENVLAMVADTGLRPESLVLELTESILLEDTPSIIVKLEALQRAGIRIGIDDFGTGYSSLSYLRRLPVDILKIAKPFVDDLAMAEENGDFARAIVGIGAALRLTLVAEGIETAQQVAQLRDLGCTLGQGYHLCHPMPAEELDALLQHGGIERARLDPEGALLDSVIPLRR